MLHIILLVLKILGIILLSILGLVILLILALLFVPVRYKVHLSVKEYGRIQCNVSWLLHIVSLKLNYDKKFIKSVRVFGINIEFLKKLRKNKNSGRIKKSREKIKKFKEKDSTGFDKRENMIITENDDYQQNDFFNTQVQNTESQFTSQSEENDDETENKHTNSIFNKLKSKISKIPVAIKKIIYQTKNICGKIKSVHQKSGNVIGFLKHEDTKDAIKFVKEQLGIFLKDIKPRKITGYLSFGTGDAAMTGEILGAYYMITKGISKDFKVMPDFDHKVLDGNMKIKGRIFIYKLIIIGYKVYKNDNLKERIDTGKSLV